MQYDYGSDAEYTTKMFGVYGTLRPARVVAVHFYTKGTADTHTLQLFLAHSPQVLSSDSWPRFLYTETTRATPHGPQLRQGLTTSRKHRQHDMLKVAGRRR